jgi:hypothetical protein
MVGKALKAVHLGNVFIVKVLLGVLKVIKGLSVLVGPPIGFSLVDMVLPASQVIPRYGFPVFSSCVLGGFIV